MIHSGFESSKKEILEAQIQCDSLAGIGVRILSTAYTRQCINTVLRGNPLSQLSTHGMKVPDPILRWWGGGWLCQMYFWQQLSWTTSEVKERQLLKGGEVTPTVAPLRMTERPVHFLVSNRVLAGATSKEVNSSDLYVTSLDQLTAKWLKDCLWPERVGCIIGKGSYLMKVTSSNTLRFNVWNRSFSCCM